MQTFFFYDWMTGLKGKQYQFQLFSHHSHFLLIDKMKNFELFN